ncbi:MAG: CD3324 family protein [Eubacteriales bacterium]|jgi:Mor family transcriptional regulator|nr:CD3324 family protein [Eubacteriales bacterium]
MTYKNAKDVLPEALLTEVQKYADGEILYIPTKPESRVGWGDRSGARIQYEKRNTLIRTMHAECCSCEELADKFYLSVDSIKKIIKR